MSIATLIVAPILTRDTMNDTYSYIELGQSITRDTNTMNDTYRQEL